MYVAIVLYRDRLFRVHCRDFSHRRRSWSLLCILVFVCRDSWMEIWAVTSQISWKFETLYMPLAQISWGSRMYPRRVISYLLVYDLWIWRFTVRVGRHMVLLLPVVATTSKDYFHHDCRRVPFVPRCIAFWSFLQRLPDASCYRKGHLLSWKGLSSRRYYKKYFPCSRSKAPNGSAEESTLSRFFFVFEARVKWERNVVLYLLLCCFCKIFQLQTTFRESL